jgi:hypothetical protein
MRKVRHALFSLIVLSLASLAAAQVDVKIIGYANHVYSFEPTMVVFEMRNTGTEGVAVPAEGCGGEGAFLEVGPVGGTLQDPNTVSDCWPDRVVWLEPGERWLIFQSAALGPEGEFDVQAVLRSRGLCGGRPVGPGTDQISELDDLDDHVRARYRCWDGEARSRRVQVAVEVPASEADLAAAEFLELEHVRWRNNWRVSLLLRFRELHRRFLTSHYTFAAFAATGDWAGMLNVVIAQPDNPLNPWMAGAMSATLAHRARPCAGPHNDFRREPPDLAERYQRVIAAYPPPKALQDYLHQQKRVYATEECPKRAAEDASDAQSRR